MPDLSPFSFQLATPDDVRSLVMLHTAVAEHLTDRYGQGHWSSETSEKGVLLAMRTSQVFVARQGPEIVGSLRLTTKKPWAIDASYFSPARHPLYLMALAVAPARQRQGIGRRCLQEALRIATAGPAEAVRLDAYDAKLAEVVSMSAVAGWREAGFPIGTCL